MIDPMPCHHCGGLPQVEVPSSRNYEGPYTRTAYCQGCTHASPGAPYESFSGHLDEAEEEAIRLWNLIQSAMAKVELIEATERQPKGDNAQTKKGGRL